MIQNSTALRTPGLAGRAKVSTARSVADLGPGFEDSLLRNEIESELTIEISDTRELTSSADTRGAGGLDDIEIEAADLGPGWAQVLLYQSEDGALSWHFPQEVARLNGTRGGAGNVTFRVPRVVVPPPDGGTPGTRGLMGALGVKVLQIFAFRLVRETAGWVGARFAEQFENRYRPHRLRTFTPDDYAAPSSAALAPEHLRRLSVGRALLVVHGTFSTTHTAFGRLPIETVRSLDARYGGRVLALDHPTASRTPEQNIRWLADHLRERGATLDLDVLCHSRGGLVGRMACERSDLAGVADVLRVNSVVLVGTPNFGTALADVARLEQLVDRFTTMLRFLPDNGVTDVLDIVLALVKQIAAGVATGLDGLMAMNPRGEFLSQILTGSARTTARYYAAAADYDPPSGSPLARIVSDGAADFVFGQEDNDLVVPTVGALAEASPSLPIDDRVRFDVTHAVDHFSYFARPELSAALHRWLPGAGAVDVDRHRGAE
ncbi:esterase/lipase family protein [Nocardia ignorata]|uniref:esterase/lipase family protein n=1 Tax=Nocardia ignorata TaxID=145285 RepID=UPI00082AD563|nr:alpha/beta hydrolase [Nocardia ignorata]